MKTTKNTTPLRAALIYAFFSAVWILLSDIALNLLIPHTFPNHVLTYTIKGWLFVLISASLLYLILRRDMNILREQQKQIRYHAGLVENVSDAIISTDMQFHIQSWNAAAERMYGWKAAEVIGHVMREFVQNEYINATREEIVKTVMEQGRWKGEVSQNHKDGRRFLVSTSLSLIKDGDGQPAGFVALNHDISESKRAEDALKASEEKYRDLVENSQSLICTHDLEGNLLSVNEASVKLSGHSRKTLLQMNIKDMLAPNGEKQFAAYLNEIKTKGRAKGIMKVRLANGESRIWAYNNTLRVEGVANPIVRGFAQDITERKLAEDALQASELRFRALIEHGLDNISLLAADGTLLWESPAATHMLGYEYEQFKGHNIFELLHSEDLEQVQMQFAEILREPGNVVHGSFRLKHADDSWRWVEGIGTNLLREPSVQAIVINYRDVTQRREAEERLRTSEETYRYLFANHSHPMWIYDLKTLAFLEVNDAAIAKYGYSRSEFLQMTLKDIRPADQLSLLAENLAQLRQTLEYSEGWHHRLKNGSIIAVSITSHTIQFGGYDAVLVTVQDITERKQAEELIRQYADELEMRVEKRTAELVYASRAKDEFLANMSHELRTPLNGILGFSETLLEAIRGPLTERQIKSLTTIATSGQHLLGLINDILDVSKIESGMFELQSETLVVNDICHSSLNFIKQLASKKHITVEYSAHPATTTLIADPKRLKQILVNLLNNAVKFTPENGNVKLEVRADASAGLMRFSVTDTGIGITPEDQQKLFKPFVQVDSSLSRQYEGTGLGLILVKKLVEMHNGSIELQSESGKGSCFAFVLPWGQEIVDAKKQYPEQAGGGENITKMGAIAVHGKILLAEDNEANVIVLKDYLESCGYEVMIADDGREVLSKAEEILPDIVLMDIQMPTVNGFEASRRLRANPRFDSVPIIALTAFAMPGDRERCLAAGMNEYLSKPVKLKELVQLIEKFLGQTSSE